MASGTENVSVVSISQPRITSTHGGFADGSGSCHFMTICTVSPESRSPSERCGAPTGVLPLISRWCPLTTIEIRVAPGVGEKASRSLTSKASPAPMFVISYVMPSWRWR